MGMVASYPEVEAEEAELALDAPDDFSPPLLDEPADCSAFAAFR
jgi:hypothetical protein